MPPKKKIKKLPIKLVIATPFYEVKAFSPYIVALMQSVKMLDALGIEWDYMEVSGDSYVDRAKNSLAHRFMESDGTHLMIIDSDMYWEPEGFGRMLKHVINGCPLIGAAYPCKNMWGFFGCIPKIDKETGHVMGTEVNGSRALDMECMPGGFIIYSRKAFEVTKPFLKEYYDVVNDITYTEYFKCSVEGEQKIRIGEDVYFQRRYKEAGGFIWLEPDITIKHMGIQAWKGNYQEHLLNQVAVVEETPLTVPNYGDGS